MGGDDTERQQHNEQQEGHVFPKLIADLTGSPQLRIQYILFNKFENTGNRVYQLPSNLIPSFSEFLYHNQERDEYYSTSDFILSVNLGDKEPYNFKIKFGDVFIFI